MVLLCDLHVDTQSPTTNTHISRSSDSVIIITLKGQWEWDFFCMGWASVCLFFLSFSNCIILSKPLWTAERNDGGHHLLTQAFHQAVQLVNVGVSWEQRFSRQHFSHQAANSPHINSSGEESQATHLCKRAFWMQPKGKVAMLGHTYSWNSHSHWY